MLWALIKPSTLALLFGPSAWSSDGFRGALAAAQAGFAPFLPAAEPSSALTWEGADLAIVPATQTFAALSGDQVSGPPQTTVTAGGVAQNFPAIAASPDQMYAARISAGLIAVFPSAPSLNATYAMDDATAGRLSAIIAGIAAGQGLPGGGTTFLHPDIAGAPHSFTADQITALAKGTRDFIYNATLARGALLAGQPASWPSNQIKLP